MSMSESLTETCLDCSPPSQRNCSKNFWPKPPHLITGADQELLKRVKQIPWKNRAYKTWLLHSHLRQLLQQPDGTPERDELASILRTSLHAHAFDQLLLLAADHAHLLNENPRRD